MKPTVTPFAPSPTGFLHLGHAYAAIIAHDLARRQGGRFLLRLEDIDKGRCRPEFENQILEDLAWLGLSWDGPVLRQSDRLEAYRAALDKLRAWGLLYPCFCTRKEIITEIARMGSAPHGPDGALYPGACRALPSSRREALLASGAAPAWRLDIGKALSAVNDGNLAFHEEGRGPHGETGLTPVNASLFGDIVLGRKDYGVSYHLAVTLDDHMTGVTLVTRGEDLLPAAHVQRLLQALLGLQTPRYAHHKLICDDSGRRLAKRDKDKTLKSMRRGGATPDDIRKILEVTNPASR